MSDELMTRDDWVSKGESTGRGDLVTNGAWKMPAASNAFLSRLLYSWVAF
jgi:hypothetical protein